MNEQLRRFLQISKRLTEKLDVSDDDLKFYAQFAPQLNERLPELQKELEKLKAEDKDVPPELTVDLLSQIAQQSVQDPIYRERVLKFAEQEQAGKTASKIAQGANLLLAGFDVFQSGKQIAEGNRLARRSRRPTAPVAPGRDPYLQNALRTAELGTMDASQAIAPVEAQIQDQYLSDLQNAKIAAGGQAGAYGAYAQLAANRRNRGAMELAPIANDVKRQEVANYNNLLGMRMGETQNMFRNQAALYPTQLDQYNAEQNMAAGLQATGRSNMRSSLANLGGQAAQTIGDNSARRRYKDLYNQLSMYSPTAASKAMPALEYLDNQVRYSNLSMDDSPIYF